MSETHESIPQRTIIVDQAGFISRVWFQFLYKLFGNFEKRIQALEATSADHETRITALEP